MTKKDDSLIAYRELDQLLADWTSTDMGRRAFMASLPLLMASCATAPKTRYREGDNSGQATSISVEDEKKMTREWLPKMRKDYPLVKDNSMQQYISQLGMRIAKANQLEGKPYNYKFSVVDVNYVNAFALPAGTIMVTTPLIAMAESEAELAGVIGHEIGHVTARHTAERIDAAKKAEKKSMFYAIGGGLLGGAAGFGLGKLLCRKNDKKCLAKATTLGAAAGAGGGLLIQKYAFMANSREDEMEADRIGFRTSVAAGFHKDHVGRFYEKLLKMEQAARKNANALEKSFADAMSTHPPSQQRVSQMREMAGKQKKQSKARISSRSFDRMKKKALKMKKA